MNVTLFEGWWGPWAWPDWVSMMYLCLSLLQIVKSDKNVYPNELVITNKIWRIIGSQQNYINLYGYTEFNVITNKYWQSHRIDTTEFDCIQLHSVTRIMARACSIACALALACLYLHPRCFFNICALIFF